MLRFNNILLLVFISTFSLSCKKNNPSLKNQSVLNPSKQYDVIIMAGQSNMVGLGKIEMLKNDTIPDNVIYFNHGTDTDYKVLESTFGPEVSLSQYLKNRFPERNFILVKYAIGGSSIKDWVTLNSEKEETSSLLLEKLFNYTRERLKDQNYRIRALLWSQGETEALSDELSLNYGNYFTKLIEQFRLNFNNKDLPIIYTEISAKAVKPSAKEILNTSLFNISKTIPNTYFTRTNDLKLQSDSLHYSNSALLKLGERFGTILENVLVLERDN
jgi:Carbohydrate esterase, sialic acid-specific acetylesterase